VKGCSGNTFEEHEWAISTEDIESFDVKIINMGNAKRGLGFQISGMRDAAPEMVHKRIVRVYIAGLDQGELEQKSTWSRFFSIEIKRDHYFLFVD
jgi:hypothetical protein